MNKPVSNKDTNSPMEKFTKILVPLGCLFMLFLFGAIIFFLLGF